MIWDHDQQILSEAEDFYAELANRYECDDWSSLCEMLSGASPAGTDGSVGPRFRQLTQDFRRAQRFWSCCLRWRGSQASTICQ
ncbi:MAG: hypothetical protein CM15mP84_08520 [Cellvibrionales bacterium]|nr:MAG: hypothetical protein CM15mP84_08520 [Cellvibrionales bacterium]